MIFNKKADFSSRIKKSYKKLTKNYKRLSAAADRDESEAALAGNYYLIDLFYTQIRQSVRSINKLPSRENGELRLYSVIQRCMADGKLPDFDALASELTEMQCSLMELDFTQLVIKCVLLEGLSKSFKSNPQIFREYILSLHRIGDFRFEELYGICSGADRILRADRSYGISDRETKAYFRQLLIKKSEALNCTDCNCAKLLSLQAKKQGVGICELLLRNDDKTKTGKMLLISEMLLPAVVTIMIGILFKNATVPFLIYFPLWQLIKAFLLDRLMGRVRKKHLVKISDEELKKAKPKTVLLISSLLEASDKSEIVKNHLKEVYLSNRDENIKLCLLADLPESSGLHREDDNARVEALRRIIAELNTEFPDSFSAFVRNRVYVRTQNAYSGYERKRGAIEQFVRFLKEGRIDSNYLSAFGAINSLSGTDYIFALDADSKPSFLSADELLKAALHPLNKAVIAENGFKVIEGYGIFMPKIRTGVNSAYKTPFSSLKVGTGGMSCYNTVAGERYFDLFSQSVFTGKGLIDVDAYYRVLNLRFKEERVLSHDILEGELLRTAYIESVEVSDAFPSGERPFLQRLHRWIRGDIQNLAFLKKNAPFNGTDGKNPLDAVAKFKLFDNFRRAFLSVNLMLILFLAPFFSYKIAVLLTAVALLCTSAEELAGLVGTFIHSDADKLNERYFGEAIPTLLLTLGRLALDICTLPRLAFNNADAIARTLIRLKTRKRLMEWVTAQQSESSHGNLLNIYNFASVLSACLVFFGWGMKGFPLSILFLSGCIVSEVISKQRNKNNSRISNSTREKMLGYAYEMWRYYEDNCDESNSFLPPDNIQFAPVYKVARRTSPTNIGMMMLSCLCARDFGFISESKLFEMLSNALTSIEKLEKYAGNLLNWYDTETLEPLYPRYVSTVDSGNFLCSLVALRQGLSELNSVDTRKNDIISRIDKIRLNTDLSFSYNERKKLFHIGLDLEKNELTDSYYDLYMSEARMTSYYAIATRQSPKEHWQALSRVMTCTHGYFGPVSWGGSMFEYFMPNMLLPSYKNTLSYEALKYCVYVQKLRAGRLPFGISESGFYKFDPDLNYAYKAHGVGRLSLQREPEDETVISPYSTFLCLPFSPKSAINNLDALTEYDSRGKYGFCEALDFSYERCSPQKYRTVKSFMAHHIGMSIVSVNNYLNDNIMQKRFMSDNDMLAAQSLLNEQIRRDAVALNLSDKPVQLKKNKPDRYNRQKNEINPSEPECSVYSNGAYTAVICDNGCGYSMYDTRNIVAHSRDIRFSPMGVFAFVNADGKKYPLQSAPFSDSTLKYFSRFNADSAELISQCDSFKTSVRVSLDNALPCELREYSIKSKTFKSDEVRLGIYFEPSMVKEEQESFHRAFSRLFVEGNKDSTTNTVIFSRKARNEREGELWCACGFTDGADFECCLSREKVLKRKQGIFALNEKQLVPTDTGKLDVCAFIERKIVLTSDAGRATFFILCADSKDELMSGIEKLRRREGEAPERATLISGGSQQERALNSRVLFDTLIYKSATPRVNRTFLWSRGISGDNPLLVINYDSENEDGLLWLIGYNRRLNSVGIFTDAVVLLRAELADKARDLIVGRFADNILDGFGLVHIVCVDTLSADELEYLSRLDCYTADAREKAVIQPVPMPVTIEKNGTNLLTETGFVTADEPALPLSLCMSNRSFGTLVSDKSLGFSFAINSYLNKLTKWNNDTMLDNTECLYLRLGGKLYDVIASSTAEFSGFEARYNCVIEAIELSISVTVPEKGMRKNIGVEIFNTGSAASEAELYYYCEPLMCENARLSGGLSVKIKDNTMFIRNFENLDYTGYMAMSMSGENAAFCTDKAAFFTGGFSENTEVFNGCAAVGRKIKLPPKRREKLDFVLSYGLTKYSAAQVAGLKLENRKIRNKIVINTGNRELDMLVNVFLPNQIIDARLNMRSSFYQCSGAYGFRDQLQDALALITTCPELAKRQILRCCAVQFPEGDVLHWWHPMGNKRRGIRSRYSDDPLWLMYALSKYVLMTGDSDILKLEIKYLEGDPLRDNENERYAQYGYTEEKSSVLEHALRGLDRVLEEGSHGLLLMKGGDWNDGMNKVGIRGRGESVWLTQFACRVLDLTAGMLKNADYGETADRYAERAEGLRANLDGCAFFSDRYARAFDDNGNIIGVCSSKECQIDLMTQSFATLGGCIDNEKNKTALDTAYRLLVDRENSLVRLLSPAFSSESKDVGYISAYPEGIRENGGQYTHAVLWFVIALLRQGEADRAYEILNLINPLVKFSSGDTKYMTEPYYLCGDVSSAEGYEGRGNWSIYTGAAGWYLTAVTEEMLGLVMKNGELSLSPKLPTQIKKFTLTVYKNSEKTVFSYDDGKISKKTFTI